MGQTAPVLGDPPSCRISKGSLREFPFTFMMFGDQLEVKPNGFVYAVPPGPLISSLA